MVTKSLTDVRHEVFAKASSPKTTVDELRPYVSHEDMETRAVLALNTRHVEILDALSSDPAWQVREEVAMNRHATPALLQRLRDDERPEVRFQAKYRLAEGSAELQLQAAQDLQNELRESA